MKTLRLEGPGKNALGTSLMTSLLGQLREASGEALLLVGAGDAFSAGLDLKEVASLDGPGMERFLRLMSDLLMELFLYPGPTVACVNGHAIAGGCLLVLACDHRVAARSPRSRIGLNEVALGLQFPPVALELARARVDRIEQVVLGAKLHDPESALRLGMVDEVVDDDQALHRAEQVLQHLENHPHEAYAAAKRDLRAPRVKVDPAAERAFVDRVLPTWTSPALKERLRRMLER